MNKINDLTIDTEHDIEINNHINNRLLQKPYESFLLLNLYINGYKMDEVHKHNVLDEDYKKFLSLDSDELNTTETNEIYQNNDQISNCDADITTNSTVDTCNQPLKKKFKIIKTLRIRIHEVTGKFQFYTQYILTLNSDVDVETTDHVNTFERRVKNASRKPILIDYIDISSASGNETYKDDNFDYYCTDVGTNSPGNTSQQTSMENDEDSKQFEIITVFPREMAGENNQERNGDSGTDINSPGSIFYQNVQEIKFNKISGLDNQLLCGLNKKTIIAKFNSDLKNLNNKCSINVNNVDFTLNANEGTQIKKTHGRRPDIISIKQMSEVRLNNSKRVSDSSQKSSAPKKSKSEQSKNDDHEAL